MAREISQEEFARLRARHEAAEAERRRQTAEFLSVQSRAGELQSWQERRDFEALGLDYEAVLAARRSAASTAMRRVAQRDKSYQPHLPGINPTLFALQGPDAEVLPSVAGSRGSSPWQQLEIGAGAGPASLIPRGSLQSEEFLSTPRSTMSPQQVVAGLRAAHLERLGDPRSLAALAVAKGSMTNDFRVKVDGRETWVLPGGLEYFKKALEEEGYTPAEQAEILPRLMPGTGAEPRETKGIPRRIINPRQGPKAPPPRQSVVGMMRGLRGMDFSGSPQAPAEPLRVSAREAELMAQAFARDTRPLPSSDLYKPLQAASSGGGGGGRPPAGPPPGTFGTAAAPHTGVTMAGSRLVGMLGLGLASLGGIAGAMVQDENALTSEVTTSLGLGLGGAGFLAAATLRSPAEGKAPWRRGR